MERFVKWFNDIENIFSITTMMSKDEVLLIASNIYEMDVKSLSQIPVESFGSGKERIPYAEALEIFFDSSCYWSKIYGKAYDDITKNTLFGMFQYWLLPDPEFLQLTPKEDSDYKWDETLNISSMEDIVGESDRIHELDYNCGINIQVDNAVKKLWQLCFMILSLNSNLKISIRMHSITDISVMIHSLPDRKWPKDRLNGARVLSIGSFPDEWENVQLLKDNGLVPYLMQKNNGCISTMAGVDRSPYEYHEKYMPDLNMEFLQNGNEESKLAYLREKAKDVDILIVNSIYDINYRLVEAYYESNPNGHTYLMLDVNSLWTDRFDVNDKDFVRMMDRIDVIGVGCRDNQHLLNIKWPWKIELFPNGWYHPWIEIGRPDIDSKEKVILTVAKIGSQPKASDKMLQAFALAADRIPKWKLKLIGNVEESFLNYVDRFFEAYPNLKERVIFTGAINDKNRLYDEYKKAAIFTLTSKVEGAPNVASEALHCGCAIATTAIDASGDITDYGKCGMIAPIDDVESIAEMYVTMASDEEELKKMCNHAYEYSMAMYSMEDIVGRICESIREKM